MHMSKAILNNLKVIEVDKTTVLQNSPLTTALQSPPKPDRPLPAFGTFLIGNLRFLDPKISTCYGCRQPLKPNQSISREPVDVVIVGRARREYWKNGEKVISSELSNVYFHINPNSVAVKNAFFVPGLVQIPTDLKPFLKESHKREQIILSLHWHAKLNVEPRTLGTYKLYRFLQIACKLAGKLSL